MDELLPIVRRVRRPLIVDMKVVPEVPVQLSETLAPTVKPADELPQPKPAKKAKANIVENPADN